MSKITSGLREAIEKVESLVLKAEPIKILTPFADRQHQRLLVKEDGSSVEIVRGPQLHAETLQTPQELASFIKFVLPTSVVAGMSDPRAEVPAEEIAQMSDGNRLDVGAVMVSDSRVVYAYEFADRQQLASVPLVKSKQYAWLVAHDDRPTKQPELEKALRITFKGNGGERLHAAVKNLKFTVGSEAEGTIGKAGDSFSRAVTRKATGADELPEDVAFTFSLFDNFVFPVTVDCSVSADTANEAVIVTAYPASLLAAQTATFDAIKDLYDVPAFSGQF